MCLGKKGKRVASILNVGAKPYQKASNYPIKQRRFTEITFLKPTQKLGTEFVTSIGTFFMYWMY